MAIEFNFTAIPTFFLKNGCLEPRKDGLHFKILYLIHYLFSRCQSVSHSSYHNQKLIHFQPWEFLCGRKEISEKTGLSENEVRNQLKRWENQGLLKKSTNGVTNQYSCYIWSTELFSQIDNQRNYHRVTNAQPTGNHKEDTRSLDLKRTTPTTSSKKVSSSSFFYECLKEVSIPEKKKVELSSKYTELRVMHAVIFCQDPRCVIKTSLLRTLFWHCMQDEPPEHGEKPLAPEIMLAHEHNAIYEQYHPKAKAKNHTLIESERKMMIWEVEKFSPLNLNNPIETLKADFKKSKMEYTSWIKKRNENKIEKMEFTA